MQLILDELKRFVSNEIVEPVRISDIRGSNRIFVCRLLDDLELADEGMKNKKDWWTIIRPTWQPPR